MFTTGDTNGLFLLLATAAACFLLMRRTARRVAKNRASSISSHAAPLRESGKPFSAVMQGDANRFQIELFDLARDLQAEMESRARVLHILIAEARREADRLENLLEQGCGVHYGPAGVDKEESGRDDFFWPLISESGGPRQDRPRVPAQAEDVYRLADEGRPPASIAAALGRPLGDVELILSLRG